MTKWSGSFTNKHLPAPFLVCTYSFGEGELPTVRAAYDAPHATGIARNEAAASCIPVVRVYSMEDMPGHDGASVCKLVSSLRF